jgi:hypothetical protein
MGDGQPVGVADVIAELPGQVVDDGRNVRGPEHHRDRGRIVLALGVNGRQCLDKL